MAKPVRSLSGSVVAITGGARGIGRATAAALDRPGCPRRDRGSRSRARRTDRRRARCRDARARARCDRPRRASRVSSTACRSASDRLDVLINNAGIMPVGPFVEETDAIAHKLVDINLHGVIIGSKLALERIPAAPPRPPRQHRLDRREGGDSGRCDLLRDQARGRRAERRDPPGGPRYRHRGQHRDARRRQDRARVRAAGGARHSGRSSPRRSPTRSSRLCRPGGSTSMSPGAWGHPPDASVLLPPGRRSDRRRFLKADQVLSSPDPVARAAYEERCRLDRGRTGPQRRVGVG